MATDLTAKPEPLPRPVIAFEGVSMAMLALEVMSGGGVAAGSMVSDVIGILFIMGLVLAISRGRSRLARWILTLLYAFGFAVMIYLISKGLLRPESITLVAWLLSGASVVQLALLWSPATTAWLKQRHSAPA